MPSYFAKRIEGGYLNYLAVVTRYPQFKTDIDVILVVDGYENLILTT